MRCCTLYTVFLKNKLREIEIVLRAPASELTFGLSVALALRAVARKHHGEGRAHLLRGHDQAAGLGPRGRVLSVRVWKRRGNTLHGFADVGQLFSWRSRSDLMLTVVAAR